MLEVATDPNYRFDLGRLYVAEPVVDVFDPRSLVAPSICHPLDFFSLSRTWISAFLFHIHYIVHVAYSSWGGSMMRFMLTTKVNMQYYKTMVFDSPQPTGTNSTVFCLSQFMSWLDKRLLELLAWLLPVLRVIPCT
ncbi:hypothetical protein C5167_035398 [Papaver somniferum]|uniref:Uncharacterized protein n=1 Tax=Papaver somniferum TaxID=3469 RepID=A0A4Y7KJ68_PAPSO|nr:hypothetical protein C5167_035398 [Papaver somniferum]